MILSASVLNPFHEEEVLAVLDVESDDPETWGEGIKRTIFGTIVSRGPVWDAFMEAWPSSNDTIYSRQVRNLVVDHDRYGNFSNIQISSDGRKISLLLVETFFTGSLAEYRQAVVTRNERVQSIFDKRRRGDFTRNELRHWDGLIPKSGVFYEQPMSAEDAQPYRDEATKWVIDNRNIIV